MFARFFYVISFIFFNISFLNAATWYISPSGDDIIGKGSATSPWATLDKAIRSMSGGDVIILMDGVYSGSLNIISRQARIFPNGTSESWTIIKAEHDGEAIIDGKNKNNMFDVDFIGYERVDRYWQFEGIIWAKSSGSNVNINNSRYIKFLRCGAYDSNDGNYANFSTGKDAEYILFENCYAWGNGRYKFVLYKSNHCILRQCVGRNDRHNALNTGPIATFAIYESNDNEVQNCISIDCDQTNSYSNYYNLSGCFYLPCTNGNTLNNNIRNSIGINSKIGAVWIDGNSSYKTDNTNITDCVFVNCIAPEGRSSALCSIRGSNAYFKNCTFINCYSDYMGLNSYNGTGFENHTKIRNSVFVKMTGSPAMNNIENEDYNCLKFNSKNFVNMSQGRHTKTAVNPIYSLNNKTGAIKYPVLIEKNSNLSKQGENQLDIGANCLKMIGKNGTLWGEKDFNSEQGEMWPFPDENIIKRKMKAYSFGSISGDRGFCAGDQSLTIYIWSCLGNPYPY